MSKKVLKDGIKKKDKRLLVALNEEQDKLIQAKADRYTNGNMSHWVRYASVNHVPKDSDLE